MDGMIMSTEISNVIIMHELLDILGDKYYGADAYCGNVKLTDKYREIEIIIGDKWWQLSFSREQLLLSLDEFSYKYLRPFVSEVCT